MTTSGPPGSIRASTVLQPAGDIRYRRIDGEAVVVRQRAAEVLVMNEVAARILDLADGRATVDAWVDVLAGEFAVDRDTLARDVLAFAGELAAEGMLEKVGSDGV